MKHCLRHGCTRELLFKALFSVAEHLDSVRHLLVLQKPQQPWWTQQQQFRHPEVEMLWEGERASVSMYVTTAVLIFSVLWEDSCLSYDQVWRHAENISFFKGGLSRQCENSTVEESILLYLSFTLLCEKSYMAPTISFYLFAVFYTLTNIFSSYASRYSSLLNTVSIWE